MNVSKAQTHAMGGQAPTISLDDADAWIFDLDGVLTDTASLHEQAWTELFQGLFTSWPRTSGRAAPAVFTGDDYRRLVDG